MTQRTDTATLSQWAMDLSGYFAEDAPIQKQLIEIADRLKEQEATIKALRAEFADLAAKAMSQEDTIEHLRFSLREACAVAADNCATIGKLRAEIDSLNKRLKR